jgi:hypothetical protein
VFYDEEPDALPWDYFLTNYERSLLNLTAEDAMSKYPKISRAEIDAERAILQENQAAFTREMDKGAMVCQNLIK